MRAVQVFAKAVRLLPLTIGVAVLFAQAAHAQTVPAGTLPPSPGMPVRPIQDPGQQLIDEQRERARQQQLNQAPASITVAPSTTEMTLDIPLDTPVDQIAEPGPTFLVNHIRLVGGDGAAFTSLPDVSQHELEAIIAPFSGHALGSHRINVLLKRLTDSFTSAGYVTTRALLAPQNLGGGTLVVTVQLGRIEAYTVNGKPVHRLKEMEKSSGGGLFTDSGYENAFPAGAGDLLRLDGIDEGVSQINRLRRNQAEVQILPGQALGDSIIAINNAPGDSVYYNLGVDNFGSEATGITRYRAGIEADNLIGLQEAVSLNYIDSTESNALVASMAVPYGRHTFSYTFSDSEYQQVIGTTALLYGRTLSHIAGWNYTLERTRADIVSIDATLSWRRSDRVVNDVALDPQHISVLRIGGNWLHKFELNGALGNVTLDAGLSQGLPWLEADHDAHGIARTDAHSQFSKLDATATFAVPLPSLGRAHFAYRGVLGGQYTNVALFGSEQLYLGGMDSIRGFRSGELAADRGFYSRNELAWIDMPAWRNGRLEPYAFLDAGKANLIATPGFPSLVGAGAGMRVQWQWRRQILSGEVLAGRALTQPSVLGAKATLVLGTLNYTY